MGVLSKIDRRKGTKKKKIRSDKKLDLKRKTIKTIAKVKLNYILGKEKNEVILTHINSTSPTKYYKCEKKKKKTKIVLGKREWESFREEYNLDNKVYNLLNNMRRINLSKHFCKD